jgi:hypothetical protein
MKLQVETLGQQVWTQEELAGHCNHSVFQKQIVNSSEQNTKLGGKFSFQTTKSHELPDRDLRIALGSY